jgi:3-methyladenine DNA glycosylase AlkD
MGHEYAVRLVSLLTENRNEENREAMENYMRNQFQFFGIKTPERNALMREFLKENGKPPVEELTEIVRTLWDQPQRECQYAAMTLLDKQAKQLTREHLPLLEEMVLTKSWWDTVDHISPHLAGRIHEKENADDYLEKWIQAEDFWLNRTSILHQLRYKEKTDESRLFRYILMHNESKEFFIQKAIGWALREYSKTNPEAVRKFIESEDLAPLSIREGLKHIKRLEKVK